MYAEPPKKRPGMTAVRLFAHLLLPAAFACGQNLLAVLDLQCDGSIPEKNVTAVSDRISEIIAKDTTYMQFERSMLPELLQQLSIYESAAECSNVQCLLVIGSLIGANYITGGSIRYDNRKTDIELHLVDVAGKKAVNSVSLQSKLPLQECVKTEIPALVTSLLHGTPGQGSAVAEKKSIFKSPFLYIGTALVGGAAAGAYYYKFHYNETSDNPGESISSEVPLDDAPQRTRSSE